MRKLRTALLAGAGAMLAAGAAVAAEKYHVMDVALPDGSLARVHYQGEVAPQLVLVGAPVQVVRVADPFAEMDRIAAAMAIRHQQMMQQVARMQAQMADAVSRAQSEMRTVSAGEGGVAPANGIVQYRFVSTTNANGCTTSVQWRSDGSGAQPQVYRTSSGDCGAAAEKASPTRTAAPAPAPAAKATPKVEEAPQTIPGARRT